MIRAWAVGMNRLEEIDVTFNFESDTPPGKDPDTHSPTLRHFHRLLWSRELPSGRVFDLVEDTPGAYLYHHSDLGDFRLTSDTMTPSFDGDDMKHIVASVPSQPLDRFYHLSYTIGNMTVFPGNRIEGKATINGARGMRRQIRDRIDLTLDCIRRHYDGSPSPLQDVLARYRDFFQLFEDFEGFVRYFLLDDLVDSKSASVKFMLPFDGFQSSPLPRTRDDYIAYMQDATKFIEARNRRIAAYVKSASK